VAADLAAAVLVGGASSRMGRDKASIRVGDATLAGRVAAALRAAGADPVVTVGGPGADVADEVPGAGPLAGVLAALRWSPAAVVVVAPCDLVSPDPAAFRALAAAVAVAGGPPAAVPDPDRPLPLALRAEALAELAASFDAGERSVRGAVARLRPAIVPLAAAAVADADRPEDLPPGAR